MNVTTCNDSHLTRSLVIGFNVSTSTVSIGERVRYVKIENPFIAVLAGYWVSMTSSTFSRVPGSEYLVLVLVPVPVLSRELKRVPVATTVLPVVGTGSS
jgi:hypothetical protein